MLVRLQAQPETHIDNHIMNTESLLPSTSFVVPVSSVAGMFLMLLGLISMYLFFLVATVTIRRGRSKRLRDLGQAGLPGYRYARLILLNAEHYLHSMQIGTFFLTLITGYYLIECSGADGLWGWMVMYFPQGARSTVFELILKGIFVMSIAAVALVFVQFFKALAFAQPERVLAYLSLPIIYSQKILSPIVRVVEGLAQKGLALFGLEMPSERERAVSAEELEEIVELSTKAGEIEEDEQEMIASVFTFSDTLVREVMTPRTDVVAVEMDTTLDDLVKIFSEEGFSRILVTGKNLDDVRGFLLAKDLLRYVGSASAEFEISKILRKPYFVPNSRKIDDLLAELRRNVTHFAVVLDEHGGVDGIVTVEDLLEEIVGEIFDETDKPEEENEAKHLPSGELHLDAGLSLHDVNEQYDFDFPAGEYDTLAGFVIHLFGRIPTAGEVITFENTQLKVEEMEQTRITRVSLRSVRKANGQRGLPAVESSAVAEEALPAQELRILGSR